MKRQRQQAIVAYVLSGIVILGVLLVRSFYGVAFSDEVCYIASLERYVQGDRFLLDDWHPPTQLNTWLIYQVIQFIPGFSITVLQARLVYVCYQVIIAIACLYMLRDRRGAAWAVLGFVFFNPYNIMALSYNTMAIGTFFLLTVFCITRKVWTAKNYVIAGILVCMSMFSNPYLITIYLAYLLVCIVMICLRKHNVFFSLKGILWITVGALILGSIFILSLIGKGTFSEYWYNIQQIFNDKEHKSNLLYKLFMSQWEVFRVYWRSTVVLVVVYMYTLIKRKRLSEREKKNLFCVSAIFVMYGIIRFSFIYGSIAVNMMMVPMTLLGVEIYLLSISGKCEEEGREHKKRIEKYFIALSFGYLFAVANYLGTNKEILSMSAMFIVPSSITVLMVAEYIVMLKQGTKQKLQLILSYGVVVVFLFCVVWLRLFFMWYDGKLNELTTRITEGPCLGLYTTQENAQNYTEKLRLVDRVGITEEDVVLFMPIDPLYYVYSEGEMATPYVTRFEVDSEELISYYESHDNKIPNYVVVLDCVGGRCSDEEEIVLQYFMDRGYEEVIKENQIIVLRSEVR